MIRFRPIITWPGPMTPACDRQRDRYVNSPVRTRQDLLRELEAIGATEAFIQGAYTDDQIRLDGMPKSGALPKHPGVILTYTTKAGTFQLPCDTFASAEQNIRAIFLTLQRLRLIEETGVRTHGKQYAGFKALPGPIELGSMSLEAAAGVLEEGTGPTADPARVISDSTYPRFCYRNQARAHHPDAGGDPAKWQRLQEAWKVVKAHHEGRL